MSSDGEVITLDAWGDTLPDWIAVLVQECDRSSQNAVAAKIAFSPAMVSQAKVETSIPSDRDTCALPNSTRIAP